jgi:hypothetical protein
LNIERIEGGGLPGHASEGFNFGTVSIKPNQINLFLLSPQARLIDCQIREAISPSYGPKSA